MTDDEAKPVLEETWTKRVDRLFAGTLTEQLRGIANEMGLIFDKVVGSLADQGGILADHATALVETKASVYQAREQTEARIAEAVRDITNNLGSQLAGAMSAIRQEIADLKRDLDDTLVTLWAELHDELRGKVATEPSTISLVQPESAPLGTNGG